MLSDSLSVNLVRTYICYPNYVLLLQSRKLIADSYFEMSDYRFLFVILLKERCLFNFFIFFCR